MSEPKFCWNADCNHIPPSKGEYCNGCGCLLRPDEDEYSLSKREINKVINKVHVELRAIAKSSKIALDAIELMKLQIKSEIDKAIIAKINSELKTKDRRR